MKSFLLIGQSNMAGRGFVHEVPSIYNERIEMLRNGRWQMMTEPINYDRPVAGVSLAASFASLTAWRNSTPSVSHSSMELPPSAHGIRPIFSSGFMRHQASAKDAARLTPATGRS